MVETKVEIPQRTENQRAENPRKKIREARLARLKVINGPPRTVKVYAGSEALRGALRHPGNQGMGGIRFRETLGEAVEWPNDAFTKRRIRDGSVRIDGPGPEETPEVDETLNPREQAEASKPKEKTAEAEQPKSKGQTTKSAPPPNAAA
jgi:hypothetical protein